MLSEGKGPFLELTLLLTREVRRHTQCRWVHLYIERWLTAPDKLADGTARHRDCGTQGCA